MRSAFSAVLGAAKSYPDPWVGERHLARLSRFKLAPQLIKAHFLQERNEQTTKATTQRIVR
jgi:hypothetical protein